MGRTTSPTGRIKRAHNAALDRVLDNSRVRKQRWPHQDTRHSLKLRKQKAAGRNDRYGSGYPRGSRIMDMFQRQVSTDCILQSQESIDNQADDECADIEESVKSATLPSEGRAALAEELRNAFNRAASLPDLMASGTPLPKPERCRHKGRLKGRTACKISERKLFGVLVNIAQIIIGAAVLQLAIVETWYKKYHEHLETDLLYVIYLCVLFIICGSHGLHIVIKRLRRKKPHRYIYISLTILSFIASAFIIAYEIRTLVSAEYGHSGQVVMVIDCMEISLVTIELPVSGLALYKTIFRSRQKRSSKADREPKVVSERVHLPKRTSQPVHWTTLFKVLLNVAHIVLGLCAIELGMVGMIYRKYMNVDSSQLFSIVFISVMFIATGTVGLFSQITGKTKVKCNQIANIIGLLISALCASVIITIISMSIANENYYTGIEAIVVFDYMILCMGIAEVLVCITAAVLHLTIRSRTTTKTFSVLCGPQVEETVTKRTVPEPVTFMTPRVDH